tara:strand:+ start:378 stop:851 length:474 start_codon:yes stop_codon:yes gene_type:complete
MLKVNEKHFKEYLKKVFETGRKEAISIIEKDDNLRQCKSYKELHKFCDANYLLFDVNDFEKNGFHAGHYLRACNALIEDLDRYLKSKALSEKIKNLKSIVKKCDTLEELQSFCNSFNRKNYALFDLNQFADSGFDLDNYKETCFLLLNNLGPEIPKI